LNAGLEALFAEGEAAELGEVIPECCTANVEVSMVGSIIGWRIEKAEGFEREGPTC